MPGVVAQILQDYSLDLRILPVDAFGASQRTVTKVVVTNSASAAVGSTTLSLRSASAVSLKAGTSLSFQDPAAVVPYGRQQVVLMQDVSLTTTAANVSVSPIKRAIALNATASVTVGMVSLAGIQQMDFNNQETQVDTTNFASGSGTEGVLVRVQRQLSINGVSLVGDEALETIVKPCGALSSAFFGREVYAIATKPNGEQFEGAAMIMALNFPANQNEIDKYSFTLNFQGSSFIWTRPYTFA